MSADPLAALDILIAEAPPESRPALVVGLAARIAAVGAGLASREPATINEPDQNIGIEAAAERLGVSTRYLYKNAHTLPFTVRLGRRLVFSTSGIARYIRQRSGRG